MWGKSCSHFTPMGGWRGAGVPRQPLLATRARAVIELTHPRLSSSSVAQLEQFSHVWIIFVFHDLDATAYAKARAAHEGSGTARFKVRPASAPCTAGRSRRRSSPRIRVGWRVAHLCPTAKSKVQAPRAGGERVGVFATRTPHRPNPVGLSLARVDFVDITTQRVYISGSDLVDGTPVLDLKPYLPGPLHAPPLPRQRDRGPVRPAAGP